MLVCTKCNIEYEEGKKFCRVCGSPLVKKVIPQTLGPSGRAGPKETEGMLICERCKVLYETGKFCKKCGSPLSIRKKEIFVEPSVEATLPQQPSEQPKVLIAKPVEPEGPKKEVKIITTVGKPGLKEVSLVKKKPILRPLYIGVGGVIVLVVVTGYLLWPKYSYLIKKQPPSSIELVQKVGPPSDTQVIHPQTKTQPITTTQSGAEEVEAIKNLLENIRQANLQKNIDLFMSCYAVEFKDREGRKAATLENWENFDYLDLSYDLKMQTISGDTANGRVEWFILTSPRGGGQAQESKVVLDVTFKKEDGDWKIKEIKSVGG